MRDNLTMLNSESSSFELSSNAVISAALRPLLKKMGAKNAKHAMSFVQMMRERFNASGPGVLSAKPTLDEASLFEANKEYLTSTLGLQAKGGLQITTTCSSAAYFLAQIILTVPTSFFTF
ncbi:unnamed protein product [Protopolystoma xenopodis]|uniref:Leucine--tRNA ligase RagD-binding domain-containing protein n=1 Tax=Protopolystoma xenopodis TaxID=117903 RepID=A0A3S5A6Q6_9PLAT|nr:unnamed protein product [Protopolystoma xenopodis]